MDEEELKRLIEKAKKIDKNMAALFQEEWTGSKKPAQEKTEANIPVYDAEKEEKNIEDLSELIKKYQIFSKK